MSAGLRLGLLETRGLVRAVQTQPDKEYRFKHSLVKDAAYRTLLREERKHLHGVTGRVLERMFPQERAEMAPSLGHHFERAHDYERAYKYWMTSGTQAMRVHAYAEAQSFFESAVRTSDEFDEPSPEKTRDALESMGRALELAGEHNGALETYRALERRGREWGVPSLELAGKISQATLYCTPSPLVDRKKGIEVSERTLAMAQEIDDVRGEIRSRWNLVLALALTPGRESEAVTKGETALELATEEGEDDLRAFLCNDVGRTHIFCGNFDRAEELLSEAEGMWRKRDNLPMLVDCLVSRIGLSLQRGQLDEVLPIWKQATEMAEETENKWAQAYSMTFLASYYLHRGEFGQCLQVGRENVRTSTATGFDVFQALTLAHLSELYVEVGALEKALEVAEKSIEAMERLFHNWRAQPLASKVRILLHEGSMDEAVELVSDLEQPYAASSDCFSMTHVPAAVVRAEVELARGRAEAAAEQARALREELQRRGMTLHIPQVSLIEGRALLEQGREQAALDAFYQGQAIAEINGTRQVLWQLLDERAAVEERLGRRDRAAELRRRAAVIVKEVSASLENSGYQDGFEARPAVRAVLEAE